jgi:hypothetical protein
MFVPDNHDGFGGGAWTAPVAPASRVVRNVVLAALLFAYAVGFSLVFERALATSAKLNEPDPVTIVGAAL